MTIRELIIEKIQKFTLLDDTFMRVIFNNVESTQFLIRIILENKNLKVEKVEVQSDYKNLRGKSAILDIVATDEDGKIYNIEVQRDSSGASPTRARYHSSLLDVNISNTNEDIKNLPKTYVIFITENDILKANKQIYHIDRVIKETNKDFEDGTHIIYVNSSMQTDTDIGRLMHDFRCKNPDEMYYKELSEPVRNQKQTNEGVNTMCRVMDELIEEITPILTSQAKLEGINQGRNEGLSQGLSQGINQGRTEGLSQGRIEGVVLVYRDDLEMDRQEAIKKLSKKFLLSMKEATQYVDKYYN